MICESARHRPPPALRPLVAWYSGYRQAGLSPARHRGLPSPYLTLIVTLDDPLTIAASRRAARPASSPRAARPAPSSRRAARLDRLPAGWFHLPHLRTQLPPPDMEQHRI